MDPNSRVVSVLSTWFIWFVVGALVLWAVAHFADMVGRRLMPSLPIIIICVLAGGIAIAAFSKIM